MTSVAAEGWRLMLEAESWRLAAGGWRLEAETGLEAGGWRLEACGLRLGVGGSRLEKEKDQDVLRREFDEKEMLYEFSRR